MEPRLVVASQVHITYFVELVPFADGPTDISYYILGLTRLYDDYLRRILASFRKLVDNDDYW
jgi:hypothetical protein